MKQLPRNSVGYPIPYFVDNTAGLRDPDFRFMDGAKLVTAIREQLCWVCGQRLHRLRRDSPAPKGVFVAGPMCLVNRTSAEPPNHGDCAEWSAKACPFLTKPGKVRREGNVPGDLAEPAGVMIARNPGVTALISSGRWRVWRPPNGGLLFDFDRVDAVAWMSEGRPATASAVLGSIDSGLPALLEVADEQPGARSELAHKLRAAMRYVPSAENIEDYPNIVETLAAL
jgi:hypothetical protein